MKRIKFLDITPDMFDDIKGKEVTVFFYENGTIVKSVSGKVRQIERSAFVGELKSLLVAIDLDNNRSVTVEEVLRFIDSSSTKQVYVEYK